MEYVYFLSNASVTLRIVNYFETMPFLSSASLTVIHQINGWIVRIRIPFFLSCQEDANVQAFLSELGTKFNVNMKLQMVFWNLDMGESVINVMRNYQVVIVSHGKPNFNRIQNFREEFSRGLGYQPETLA
jgi:hypothetical protein